VDTAVTERSEPKPARARWIVGVSFVVAAIGGLAAWAFLSPGALAYYKTPSEIAAGIGATHETLRVGGRVAAGTLDRDGSLVRFTVTDGKSSVPVVFRGDVPDTLKEDTDVIAEGRMDGAVMRATRVQAKCSSKFVPKDRPQDLGATGDTRSVAPGETE
jgi:cytochrome c-type biogenesis protein CcmE